MNNRTLILLGAGLLAVTGLACHRSIRTSSYIVHKTYRSDLGVSSQGILRWVPEGPRMQGFKVRFVSDNPCRASDTLEQNPRDGTVTCHVKENNDGVFAYVVEPKGFNGQAAVSVENYLSVDGCKMPCPGDDGQRPVRAQPIASASIHIECQSGGATTTNPPNLFVSPGESIEFVPVGLAGVAWSVTGLDSVCEVAPGSAGSPICTIKQSVQGAIHYQASVNNCPAGSGLLTVPAP